MLKKYKKGAASFYIVAFSTLILVLIATSFALVITSEIARTSNDDLSQSAYDSALAGTEDAKVAYSNYRRCVEAANNNPSIRAEVPVGNGEVTCKDILYWMEHPDCYMVGHILGKIPKSEQAEVVVGGVEKTGAGGETTTNQAYTCVIINTELNDYRTTLTASKRVQTMKASVGTGAYNEVKKLKLSWYSVRNDASLKFTNYNETKNMVSFPAFGSSTISVPPTVELQIVQTGPTFTLGQFDQTASGQTNRGTLYLVPTGNSNRARNSAENYIGIWNGSSNRVSAGQVVKTNDRWVMNRSFLTYCDKNSTAEFYCSVEVEMPMPIGGGPRNNDTFMISIALPYQQPDTDFSIELICTSGTCGTAAATGSPEDRRAKINNTQISIDSTGRANDLYRRVETRLETADTTFGAGYPYYALEVLGPDGFQKMMTVNYENYFYF
ncbi:hypothetical protein IKG07_00865 [Candidatus Saccharibacteria bacterium]|nr:hypothetical protein [Candidatus Saccharibacteria bacterium]